MKLVLYGFVLSMLLMASCKEQPKTSEAPNEDSQVEVNFNGLKSVDTEHSTLYWKGYKIMGNHTGTIGLKSGSLVFDKGAITGGEFVVDMQSVKVTELMDSGEAEEEEEESDEDDKSDLAQHLMDADFFDSETHPTSTFQITNSTHSGNTYQINGNLTIKGVQKEASFEAQMNENILKGTLSIDRTQFGVTYGSGSFFENLGDRAIKDKFDIEVSLHIIE